MTLKIKAFLKANGFVFTSFKEYRKFSTASEKAFDIIGTILFSAVLILVALIFFNTSVSTFIDNFQSFNNIVITSISILAGFNVASISVIATSQSELVNKLRDTPSETDPEKNKFSIIIIFFTWAIIIQLIVIFTGIILHFICQFFIAESVQDLETPKWIWILFGIWLSLVLHSITISVRNVKMLYLFIINGS